MRNAPFALFALSILAAAVVSADDSQPTLAAHPEVASAITLYEIWVREQMAYRHQPGLSVGIVHDQELVWARGFGVADVAAQRPAAADTVYRIGSVSKTVTATALMLLRDAGKLLLDDPVRSHLPWFEYRNPFPDGAEVTVWHLLTHTSGLPRESAFPYWTDREFPTREQMKQALAGQEGLFEPGTGYQYSNLAIALAGEVVAAASGESYANFVRARILEPLGMASTFVELPTPDLPRLATGYLVSRPDGSQPLAPGTDARGLTPAANLSSTVEDLARFVSAHLGGGRPLEERLLRASTLREMHRVQWLSPSWSSGRGLGFSIWPRDGRTLVGHGGWVAGHRAQIAFDPESRLGVIVLTNSDEGGPGAYVRQAFDLVVPAIEKAIEPPPEPAPVLADASRYVGAYHNPWGEVSEVLVMGGKLVIYDHSYPPTDNPEGSITRLVPDGEHAFRMEAPAGRRGRPVVFELLEDGRVARVKKGENYLFPAGCGRIDRELQCTWE
jgi:CubicO group peptidase (beta-lactamase class C family)